jgi:hypothetical protein
MSSCGGLNGFLVNLSFVSRGFYFFALMQKSNKKNQSESLPVMPPADKPVGKGWVCLRSPHDPIQTIRWGIVWPQQLKCRVVAACYHNTLEVLDFPAD